MAEPLLRVDNLVRRYGGITATDNLSMEVVPGELHAIIGPNGAGKTTLISQLTGQVMPNSGTIRFAGRDVRALNRGALRDLRRDMQIIFQDPYASLNPRLTVGQALGEPLRLHGLASGPALRRRIDELLTEVGLSFGGIPERLNVPFAAVTRFLDPSAPFDLRFDVSDALSEEAPAAPAVAAPPPAPAARAVVEPETAETEQEPAKPSEGAEVVRLGRSAAGETLGQGCWRSRLQVCRRGPEGRRWELVDPLEISGASLAAEHGMAGQPVLGSLVWAAPQPLGAAALAQLLANCRSDRQGLEGDLACGALDQGLIARYRGPSSQAARFWFTRVWARIRAARGLSAPELPRVWPFQEQPLGSG